MKKFIKSLVLSNSFLTKIGISLFKLKLKKSLKVKFGKKVFIGLSTQCGGRNYFGNYSSIYGSAIDYASYLSDNTHISKTKIGKYCSIGPNVKCIFGNHPTHTFVSTHPAFFSIRKQVGFSYTSYQLFPEFAKNKENSNYSIIIGNDVWIGANVSLLDGVSVGDGAIIAANTFINKDVPPYTIVGGLPAKVLKKRFADDKIDFLLRFRWWEKEESWIRNNADKFTDIENFFKTFKNEQ